MVDKPVHTIILDAGPIILGEPSVSSLLQHCEELVSTPAVVSEIKDEAGRSRLETLRSFLILKTPSPASVKVITEFARKTGDLSVLSRTDIQILALGFELECERNDGDWRLRSTPGQRRTNGPPPSKSSASQDQSNMNSTATEIETAQKHTILPRVSHTLDEGPQEEFAEELQHPTTEGTVQAQAISPPLLVESEPHLGDNQVETHENGQNTDSTEAEADMPSAETLAGQLNQTRISDHRNPDQSEDSGSEGWITPSNIKKYERKEAAKSTSTNAEPKTMQVATITTDYAMQNVLLQMNLNLLSTSLQRVRHIKTFVLRCHACFTVCKDMSKVFCPQCGAPTLTRVTCTTNQQTGEFKLHLKKNMQWNTRGDRYSIPKPVSGSANGRVKGGGKGGWGQALILAEDQKEYVKAVKEERKLKQRDLMDEDYLPGILSENRRRAGGRPKVGAGRNVNSRKR
jgi:RNA-binding protein NOB1